MLVKRSELLSRIITLTTDFGFSDGTVGAMIGVIKSICPTAEVVIASADVPAGDVHRGAWALFQAAPFFPPNSIHVAVVDPGVGTDRRGLVVGTDRGQFIGPDNGILSWAWRVAGRQSIRVLTNRAFRLASPGITFDGRDLFAPAAAYLASGVDPRQMGPEIENAIELEWPEPDIDGSRIVGEVLVADHFGNLISNITMDDVARLFVEQPFTVTVGDQPAGGLVGGYERIVGSLGTVINGSGLLEIAAKGGSAARITGLGRGARVVASPESGVR